MDALSLVRGAIGGAAPRPMDWFQRNRSFTRADHGPFFTYLQQHEVPAFEAWVRAQGFPYTGNPQHPQSDYDLGGYWRALNDPSNPEHHRTAQGWDLNDQRWHLDNNWKTPHHPLFSTHSRYAKPNAPSWQGPPNNPYQYLIDQGGHTLFTPSLHQQ